jgi:hypothetical protein
MKAGTQQKPENKYIILSVDSTPFFGYRIKLIEQLK